MNKKEKNKTSEGAEPEKPLSQSVENAHAVGDGSVGRDKDWMVEEEKTDDDVKKDAPPY